MKPAKSKTNIVLLFLPAFSRTGKAGAMTGGKNQVNHQNYTDMV